MLPLFLCSLCHITKPWESCLWCCQKSWWVKYIAKHVKTMSDYAKFLITSWTQYPNSLVAKNRQNLPALMYFSRTWQNPFCIQVPLINGVSRSKCYLVIFFLLLGIPAGIFFRVVWGIPLGQLFCHPFRQFPNIGSDESTL